jgi:PAS domain S-box-containing protein
MDRDYRINLFNQGAERIFGYKASEVLGQPLDRILPVRFREVHRQHEQGFAKSPDTARTMGERLEVFGCRKDGTEFPAEVSISKLVLGNEVFFTSIVRDVTERKLVEETLRTSEESYRDLVEEARDIIYTADLTGRFTSLNRAGEQLTGYSRQEAVTMNFADVVAPDNMELVREMLARKIAGEPATVYELEIVTKDSRHLTLEINSRPIYRDGEAVGIQGVARDITERRQLEEQLRQSQKMECVGRLAGGVAHDFNNLLTVITGYSELLLKRFVEDEDSSWKLEEIRKASKRASALTYQLLAFSRKQVLQPKLLDINAIVNDVGKMLQRLIGEDIELVMVLHPAVGQIKADPGQISQIIMNLAVNARDAMPQGGKLSVETANIHLDQEYVRHHLGAKPGSYVMLALVDTGIGIDSDIQQQIFEPFFTTKGSGGGTGLGLATVYGIVKQSGGYITVESEIGLGSTFKVYLPLVDVNDEADTAGSETPSGEMLEGTEKILLVEDEQAVRALARQVLEMCGYDVLEARDGVEAVSICQRVDCAIDLLVTDVVMPQMSGGELAEQLSVSRPEMRVLYMSGYTDDAIVRHGLGEGSANFIQKPFTPETLARQVREALGAPQKC